MIREALKHTVPTYLDPDPQHWVSGNFSWDSSIRLISILNATKPWIILLWHPSYFSAYSGLLDMWFWFQDVETSAGCCWHCPERSWTCGECCAHNLLSNPNSRGARLVFFVEVRKFLGSFCFRKYANFISVPVRKSNVQILMIIPQIHTFVHNTAQLCQNSPKSRLQIFARRKRFIFGLICVGLICGRPTFANITPNM